MQRLRRGSLRPEGAHCGSANVKTGANHHSMPFRCRQKGCAKRFSTKTGTVMECSNLGFQVWAIAIFLVATTLKGISSMKLHRDLGVTQKTAWFLAHRIRETWQDTSSWFAWLPGFHPFDGPIEADETYVGGKRKNMSHEKRKQIRGRGTVGKVAVAGVKDRATGQVSARVVQNTDSVTLQGFVQHHGTPGATVYTDAALAYRGMTGFEHQAVNHRAPRKILLPPHEQACRPMDVLSGTGFLMVRGSETRGVTLFFEVPHSVGEYVRDGAHTNGIESFWSMLKRGYVGVFHQLSAKHLNRYVAEFAGRHNIRLLDTLDMIRSMVVGIVGKRLPYKTLVA